MFSVATLALFTLGVSAIAILLWKALQLIWRRLYKSPLRHLQGPRGTSLILGNLGDFTNDENHMLIDKWFKEYGSTLRIKGFLNNDQLLTIDTRAVNHILTHSNDYQKPLELRSGLARLLGEGLILSEGVQHRQQRRVMNPAFGPAQIRALTATFFEKTIRLCEILSAEVTKEPTAATTGKRVNIVPWLNRVTLDIIGLTGFNYSFDALDLGGQQNELNKAISALFSLSNSSLLGILRSLFPILAIIPSAEGRKVQAAQNTLTRIGEELLTKAKSAALVSATEKGKTEKGDTMYGRDLLSLLVKANLADTEKQRLSDKDVLAQVPTFMIAGHETTSTAVTWALYALTQVPEVQTKLRDELLSVDTDTPSMDELMELPYLDAVVRESLRLRPPIPSTMRVAMKDDVLPVEKPYTDRYGIVHDTITIAKGDPIHVPIHAMNRSEEIWGPDAHEFKPERWNDTPEAASQIPGVWGHMLTFIGGPRACIGYRFSLVEMKVMLFSLVRVFEFALAVPASEVSSRTLIVQRPVLCSDSTRQSQLPLLVKPYQRT